MAARNWIKAINKGKKIHDRRSYMKRRWTETAEDIHQKVTEKEQNEVRNPWVRAINHQQA